MKTIKRIHGELSENEQSVIQAGFDAHSVQSGAPTYEKTRLNWLLYDSDGEIVGALTADLLWDWIYIDELWVDENVRGQGFGKQLMNKVENLAYSENLSGIWLWTQSWQAAEFYQSLDYQEFARFPDFPKGHFRVGYCKHIGLAKICHNP